MVHPHFTTLRPHFPTLGSRAAPSGTQNFETGNAPFVSSFFPLRPLALNFHALAANGSLGRGLEFGVPRCTSGVPCRDGAQTGARLNKDETTFDSSTLRPRALDLSSLKPDHEFLFYFSFRCLDFQSIVNFVMVFSRGLFKYQESRRAKNQ